MRVCVRAQNKTLKYEHSVENIQEGLVVLVFLEILGYLDFPT